MEVVIPEEAWGVESTDGMLTQRRIGGGNGLAAVVRSLINRLVNPTLVMLKYRDTLANT